MIRCISLFLISNVLAGGRYTPRVRELIFLPWSLQVALQWRPCCAGSPPNRGAGFDCNKQRPLVDKSEVALGKDYIRKWGILVKFQRNKDKALSHCFLPWRRSGPGSEEFISFAPLTPRDDIQDIVFFFLFPSNHWFWFLKALLLGSKI